MCVGNTRKRRKEERNRNIVTVMTEDFPLN